MSQLLQRLKTRPQFQAVLGGELVAKTSHFSLHRVELGTSSSTTASVLFPVNAVWLGAMTPKRWAKRATTRNAIRRQIYTVSASLSLHFPQAAFLIRLRREFARRDYPSATSTVLKEDVRSELLELLQAALAQGKPKLVAV